MARSVCVGVSFGRAGVCRSCCCCVWAGDVVGFVVRWAGYVVGFVVRACMYNAGCVGHMECLRSLSQGCCAAGLQCCSPGTHLGRRCALPGLCDALTCSFLPPLCQHTCVYVSRRLIHLSVVPSHTHVCLVVCCSLPSFSSHAPACLLLARAMGVGLQHTCSAGCASTHGWLVG